MEISILLTFLIMIVSLGGLFLRAGKLCLIEEKQIKESANIKYNLINGLSAWTVKFVLRGLYLLNTVALFDAQKVAQTTSIQSQNLIFEG
ncbi:hypothetical protein [Falsiporphyromonas endometrii]|uniref:ATP synthase F0 subunit 8 n=1 Tax=Falsiporphyromonas endometrii TaxID=1387297 RepID=A0ABV9K8H4_9PORP